MIFGKPDDPSQIGANSLKITGQVNVGFVLTVSFPNPALFPGEYLLFVKEEGACISTSTDNELAQALTEALP